MCLSGDFVTVVDRQISDQSNFYEYLSLVGQFKHLTIMMVGQGLFQLLLMQENNISFHD